MSHRSQPRRRVTGASLFSLLPIFAIAFALVLLVSSQPARVTPASAATTPLTVYNEGLASGWSNCSWDSTVNLMSLGGFNSWWSISQTVTRARGGICLYSPSVIDGGGYTSLTFAARTSATGGRYQVFLYGLNDQPLGYVWLANAGGDPSVGWKSYTIPLSSLGAAATQTRRLAIQRIDTGTNGVLYVDNIIFQPNGQSGSAATPTRTATPAVAATATPAAASTPASGSSLSVFYESLAGGWNSCSWGGSANFNNGSTYFSGSRSISFTTNAARGGLCMMAGSSFDSTPYANLRFVVRGGQDGARYQVFMYDSNGQPTGQYVPLASFGGDPVAASWKTYEVPLTLLGAARRQVKGIAIQSVEDTSGRTIYVDDVSLVSAPASAPTPATSPLALGAYISGGPGNTFALDAFNSAAGKAPSIVMWYEGWGSSWWPHDFNTAAMNTVTNRGQTPMLTWMPWGDSSAVNQPDFALSKIIAGNHDAYIRRWAQSAKAWGKTLYLRFAHEMNGNWYSWSPGVNGNQTSEFVPAWRRVHDIFRQEGATNVKWVWSPNVVGPGATQFNNLYPGDAYVDWVALGGYNWGSGEWTSFEDVFAYSYDQLAALTGKPIMIGETASSEAGGDKAAWIRSGLLTAVPNRFPRVKAVIWFNENKERDWRINSSSASQTAFREVATSPLYTGKLP